MRVCRTSCESFTPDSRCSLRRLTGGPQHTCRRNGPVLGVGVFVDRESEGDVLPEEQWRRVAFSGQRQGLHQHEALVLARVLIRDREDRVPPETRVEERGRAAFGLPDEAPTLGKPNRHGSKVHGAPERVGAGLAADDERRLTRRRPAGR